MFTVNEGQVIESFQGLLKDLEQITYGSYLCELIHISMEDGDANNKLFIYLISAFYFMKNQALDLETLARAFEVKLLQCTGFSLNLEYCANCRKKIIKSDFISLQYGGGICEKCEKDKAIPISNGAYNALRFLSKMPFEKIYRVSLSDSLKEELYKILSLFISQNYLKKPKSLETLHYLKGVNKNE